MKTPASKLVKIAQKTANSGLSRGQKLFKKLIKKIDAQRALVRAWQTAIPLYQQKHTSEFSPLLETFDLHRTQLVMLFDRAHDSKSFNKAERTKLAELIMQFTDEILIKLDSAELKAIYSKYHGVDFDSQDEQFNSEVKTMLEDMFGVEMEDEVDMKDPDALLRMMAQHAKKTAEKMEAEEEAQASRKKSAKQIAKEAKQEQEEKSISLSIREVFRKLASTLHPDREQDPAERKRKTDLMQRVNVAYGNKDLLQLLELQLEVEQIDESMINTISEDRLKHYNKILNEQSDELEMEVDQNLLAFSLRFQLDPHAILDPESIMADLEQEIIDMQDMIEGITEDIERFAQVKELKTWLKNFRTPAPRFEQSLFDEMSFGFDFDFEAMEKTR